MSAGVVFQQALRVLGAADLPDVARSDVLAVLEAGRTGPLQLFYDAASEAGVERDTAVDRGAACFFGYCAGQLADDLIDGDCSYLGDPWRNGPAAQYLLQNLFVATSLGAGVSARTLREVALDLVAGAGPEFVEVRTHRWTAELARHVAEGLAGRQFGAYLRVLWAGTPFGEAAARVGMSLGIAAHTAADIRSGDPRFHGLSVADRSEIVDWARSAVAALRGEELRCLEAVLRDIDPVLASPAPAETP